MSYTYPIEIDWTHQEMADVIALWQAVEQAYETGVKVDVFNAAYKQFKCVVPSKSHEKQLAKQFEKESGYVLYHVQQAIQNSDKTVVKLEK